MHMSSYIALSSPPPTYMLFNKLLEPTKAVMSGYRGNKKMMKENELLFADLVGNVYTLENSFCGRNRECKFILGGS